MYNGEVENTTLYPTSIKNLMPRCRTGEVKNMTLCPTSIKKFLPRCRTHEVENMTLFQMHCFKCLDHHLQFIMVTIIIFFRSSLKSSSSLIHHHPLMTWYILGRISHHHYALYPTNRDDEYTVVKSFFKTYSLTKFEGNFTSHGGSKWPNMWCVWRG